MEKRTLLATKNICKSFGLVRVLQNINITIKKNEIVGLVGDNGAGKTTLIKIFCGTLQPNIGQIFFEDKSIRFSSPRDAIAAGIDTLHQDVDLIHSLKVYENIFLGRWITRNFLGGLIKTIDDKEMRRRSQQLLERIGINLILDKITEELSGGERRAVTFARSISTDRKPKLLILDEPTASLGVNECRKILNVMRRLRKERVSIIFISHNLKEIFSVVDRIIVLRNGRKEATKDINQTNPEEIIHLMTIGKKEQLNSVEQLVV